MNKIIIGTLASIIAALTIAATGWNFQKTAEIPEKYVTKKENSEEHKEINRKLDKIYDFLLKQYGKDD